MGQRYSARAILRNALSGQRNWPQAWASPEPSAEYDVVLIGGGGHGLATAYYLARDFPDFRVAVLEKGWIGGGNTGRNTTIVRSDYFYPESLAFYDHSLRLYEGLGRELNFNIMLSQRGLLNLAHSRAELDFQRRMVNAMLLAGVDAELVGPEEVRRRCPGLDFSPGARFPILGALAQQRAGTVRHDAVAWGYARAASARGAHILQNCAVTAIRRDASGAAVGVETTRGPIRARRIGIATAGHSAHVCEMAGFRIPVGSFALQAFVSEPLKPCLDIVLGSAVIGTYVSQSDKGGLVFGGGIDPGISYAQRGAPHVMEQVVAGLIALVPAFGRVQLLRQWAGIVDYTADSSPILGRSPVPGVYLNVGWGGGGFKAIPAGGLAFAHTIANDNPHPLAAPFALDRFAEGRVIDEAAAAGIEH